MPGPAKLSTMNSVLTLYADLTGDVSNKIYLRQVEWRLNRHPAISEKFDIAHIERVANSFYTNSRNHFPVQLSLIKTRLQKFLVDSATAISQTAVRRLNLTNQRKATCQSTREPAFLLRSVAEC